MRRKEQILAKNLPPSGSWSGDWGTNKVPYGQHYRKVDRKAGKSGCWGKSARTFALVLVACSIAAAISDIVLVDAIVRSLS
jgi:hypothetical protein